MVKTEQQTTQLIELDPSHILANDNSRFGLKPSRVESMAQSIMDLGGIRVPVEVESLDPKVGKFTHKLKSGFYRVAAATMLNDTQKAGILVPAIVRQSPDELTRLREQLSENMDRENQSPMDQAVAVKKLMDAGVSRLEIRTMFSRPNGKKGAAVPASNSWLNIVLGFLDLPKTVQAKIHDGVIGVKAAYQLSKVPADKRAAIIEAAEAENAREREAEEKEEKKFLEAQRKVEEAKAKVTGADAKIKEAQAEVEKASAAVETKMAELAAAKKLPYLEAEGEEKKAIMEKVNAASNDVKSAQKFAKDAKNALAKLHEDKTKAEEVATEQVKKLEGVKPKAKEGRGKSTGVSDTDIKKAAKATGVMSDAGNVPLGLAEIRIYLKSICADTAHPIVASIGKVLRQAYDGVTTEKEMMHDLAVITGEEAGELTVRPEPVAKVKSAKK